MTLELMEDLTGDALLAGIDKEYQAKREKAQALIERQKMERAQAAQSLEDEQLRIERQAQALHKQKTLEAWQSFLTYEAHDRFSAVRDEHQAALATFTEALQRLNAIGAWQNDAKTTANEAITTFVRQAQNYVAAFDSEEHFRQALLFAVGMLTSGLHFIPEHNLPAPEFTQFLRLFRIRPVQLDTQKIIAAALALPALPLVDEPEEVIEVTGMTISTELDVVATPSTLATKSAKKRTPRKRKDKN